MRPTAPLLATLGILVMCATSSIKRAEGFPPTDDRACVQAAQRDDLEHMLIAMEFKNDCAGPRACMVTWSVKCDGKSRPHKEAVVLAVSEVKTVTLSAAGCDGDWEIQPAKWSCRTAKK